MRPRSRARAGPARGATPPPGDLQRAADGMTSKGSAGWLALPLAAVLLATTDPSSSSSSSVSSSSRLGSRRAAQPEAQLQARQQLGPALSSLFEPPHLAERIANGTNIGSAAGSNASVDACATACLKASECVSFTYDSAPQDASCRLSGYSMSYDRAIGPNTSAWHLRRRPRNDTGLVGPAVDYTLSVPTGGVRLHDGILREAFEGELEYLLAFYKVDDVLVHFRERGAKGGTGPAAGVLCTPNPPTAKNHGWDAGLRGSVAGLFLMGSGGILRWEEHSDLREMMDAVIEGIANCAQSDGYIAAFPQNDTHQEENPNYVTAWLTHGLLEASTAGNHKALPLIRGHLDWFNNNSFIPLFLPPAGGPASYEPDFFPNPCKFNDSTSSDSTLITCLFACNLWLRVSV